MKLRFATGLLGAVLFAACGSPSSSGDAGADAGAEDSGALDAGPTDAGRVDAGAVDAGPVDAGPIDAGPIDAGAACVPGGDGGYVHTPFTKISNYCLVSLSDGGVSLNPAVMPYDLNTPLFSDYALKVRGVWVPPGEAAIYDGDGGVFAFPVGTILTKSFGLRDDLRKTEPVVDWVETRLLINTDAGWKGYAYIWDDGGADATLSYSGEVKSATLVDYDGGVLPVSYLVPSLSQCKQCHANLAVEIPIGPKARNLNRDFAYATGIENQLTHWSNAGILVGAPADPNTAPRLAVWNDPSTGTLEQRARAYLETNCAHCHSAGGYARTTGLFLWADEPLPATYGVCKTPVAAGPATGGFEYDIAAGNPEQSIMIYRMSSTTPQTAMPLIGRSVVDVQGVQLVSDWISSLTPACP